MTTTTRILTTLTITTLLVGAARSGRFDDAIAAVNADATIPWSAGYSDSIDYEDAAKMAAMVGTLIPASSGPRQLEGIDLNVAMAAERVRGSSRLLQTYVSASSVSAYPASLDLRVAYPQCLTLQMIRNQGACGSCWAVSSMTSLTDRYCINAVNNNNGTAANRFFSFENLLDCCTNCQNTAANMCGGGYMIRAFNQTKYTGVVTGDAYGGSNFCKAYIFSPYSSNVNVKPTCTKTCASTYTQGNYTSDLTNGKIKDYQYGVGVDAMIKALNDGPIACTMYVYEDLYYYTGGVYTVSSTVFLGGHGVRMIGYGTDATTGVDYWLVANSWGMAWGELGYFRIRRGTNEANIESIMFFAGVF